MELSKERPNSYLYCLCLLGSHFLKNGILFIKMNEPSSRTKKNLALTTELNKQLKEQKEVYRSLTSCSKTNRSETEANDPDYHVSSSDMESSESDENMLKSPTNKIFAEKDDGNETIEESVKFIVEKLLTHVDEHFTTRGTKRKRRKYKIPLRERNLLKLENFKNKHRVKQPCSAVCKKKCISKISDERRVQINQEFWAMTPQERKNYMYSKTKKVPVKRRTAGLNSRRNFTVTYVYPDDGGIDQEVCKTFFLATMGFNNKVDKCLRTVLKNTPNGSLQATSDRRGSHSPTNKIDRTSIINHINSFEPSISHYRRVHAPNGKYLPTDLNIQMMYNDFKIKEPNIVCSYKLYRKTLQSMNISFVKLGHEECFVCEKYFLHEKDSQHKRDEPEPNCSVCKEYTIHKKKATESRK
ncbi:uncharacterized protein LOC126737267 isoform X2 [Anthonomus grandis grandis]|nr:uncharacterized protein LOC126737267 isoform X2 [Anthonomus grandis grandis]